MAVTTTIQQVVDALEAAVATISDLEVYDYVPDDVAVPCAFVWPAASNFDMTIGRGGDRQFYTIRILVSRTSDREGQTKLFTYMNPSGSASVKAAIESDKTLGGVADTLWVRSRTGVQIQEVAGIPYFSCDFTVEVVV